MRSNCQQAKSLSKWVLSALLIIGFNLSFGQNTYKLISEAGGPTQFSQIHIVKPGETLWGLSRKYEVTIADLKKWNGLQKDAIFKGQRLLIEMPAAETPTAETPTTEEVTRGPENAETIDIAFDGHLSDLFADPSEEDYTNWETVVPASDDTEWAPFGSDDAMMGPSLAAVSRTVGASRSAAETQQKFTKRTYHEVKAGEDIYSIADAFHVRVDQLRAWNAIIDVMPGDVIIVNKKAAKPSDPIEEAIPAPSQSTRGLLPATNDTPQASASNARQVKTENNEAAQTLSSNRPTLGKWMLSTPFVHYEGEKVEGERFYALHKHLPVGSTVKMAIPQNQGYVTVKIVGKLPAKQNADLALSIACVRILEGAGENTAATLYYN
jgi:LysM repeat protein